MNKKTTPIFAIANQKGGVGKTTTAVNVSSYLAGRGVRTLLVDLDPQGNATSSLGVEPQGATLYDLLSGEEPAKEVIHLTSQTGLDLLPASRDLAAAEVEFASLPDRDKRLEIALEPILNNYDIVIIDCPPSLGLLTINAMSSSRGLIVPIQCEYLALEGLGHLVSTVQLVKSRINPTLELFGIVMTMFDSRTRLSKQVVEEVQKHYPNKLFRTLIPRSVYLSEAPSYGQSIFEYYPSSKAALAYSSLGEEFLDRIKRVYGLAFDSKPDH